VILLLAIFSSYLSAAYQTVIWPLLGFFVMPYTTLAYAWAINTSPSNSLQGGYLIIYILAILIDLGVIGGGAKARKHAAA
jgi:hypothetical protein